MPNPAPGRICSKCGKSLDDNDQYCGSCCTEWTPPLPSEKKKCINAGCSKLLRLNAKFCGKCAAPQEPPRRMCCGEYLDSDDEYCCNCRKHCPKEPGADVQNIENKHPSNDESRRGATAEIHSDLPPSIPKETMSKNTTITDNADPRDAIQGQQGGPIGSGEIPGETGVHGRAPEKNQDETPSKTAVLKKEKVSMEDLSMAFSLLKVLYNQTSKVVNMETDQQERSDSMDKMTENETRPGLEMAYERKDDISKTKRVHDRNSMNPVQETGMDKSRSEAGKGYTFHDSNQPMEEEFKGNGKDGTSTLHQGSVKSEGKQDDHLSKGSKELRNTERGSEDCRHDPADGAGESGKTGLHMQKGIKRKPHSEVSDGNKQLHKEKKKLLQPGETELHMQNGKERKPQSEVSDDNSHIHHPEKTQMLEKPEYESKTTSSESQAKQLPSGHSYHTRSEEKEAAVTDKGNQVQAASHNKNSPNNETNGKGPVEGSCQKQSFGEQAGHAKLNLPTTHVTNMDPHKDISTRNTKSMGSRLAVELVSVTFKVVIGPEFKCDRSECVYVCIYGWMAPCQLSVERELEDDYYLMTVDIPIYKAVLTSHGIRYKYVVISSPSGKCKFEDLLKADLNPHECRILRWTTEFKRDDWTVYDIIMFPNRENFLKKSGKLGLYGKYCHPGSYKVIQKGRTIGASAMLPEWPTYVQVSQHDYKLLGEDFITQIKEVLKSMGNLILDKSFKLKDLSLIQEIMKGYLQHGLKTLIELQTVTDIRGAELRLFIAVAASFIIYRAKMEEPDADLKLICESLLLSTDWPDCTAIEEFIRRHYFDMQRTLPFYIALFIKRVMSRKLPHWLCAMPLLHFLGDECRPWQPKSSRRDHNAPDGSWWGVDWIKDDLEKFKCEASTVISKELMDKLRPSFQMDFLLPRTILATVKTSELQQIQQLEAFDLDACLALVYYHIMTGNPEGPALKDGVIQVLEHVQCQLTVRKSNWENENLHEQKALMQEVELCCFVCKDILEQASLEPKLALRTDYMRTFAQTSSCSIMLLWDILHNHHQMNGEFKQVVSKWETVAPVLQMEFKSFLLRWLDNAVSHQLVDGYQSKQLLNPWELQAFSFLLDISWPEKQIQANYVSELRLRLQTRILALDEEKILDLSRNDYSKLHAVIEEVISAAAFEAVEKLCATGKFWSIQTHDDIAKFRYFLSDAFLKAWPKDTQDAEQRILEHGLKWPSMTNFIRLLVDPKMKDCLNENCLSKLQDFIDLLDNITRMMISGEIGVDYMKTIFANEKTFLGICDEIMKYKDFAKIKTLGETLQMKPMEVVKKVLKLRQEEMDEFKKVRRRVEVLLAKCKEINTDVDYLEKNEFETSGSLFLHHLCRPRILEKNDDAKLPKVTFFELPAAAYEILDDLWKCHKFELFSVFWKRAAAESPMRQKDDQNILTLEEVVEYVWHPAVSQFNGICGKIEDGSVTLEEVAYLVTTVGDLKKEIREICALQKIGGDLSWIDKRFKQFNHFEKLQSTRNVAETILLLVEKYNLKGNFSFVEGLLESELDPNQSLDSIQDKMVINVGQTLEKVGKEQLQCMHSFIKAREMIMWLRENLKGTQEVKVLVELAMIRAAGQGDIEINRVSCLHLAVTGFAPLIYDLKETAGFDDLMACLKEVWRVQENNKNLSSSLDEVTLQWLQDVHKAHGDVEMNALELATTINDKGVFCVGKPIKEINGKLSMNDVVSLVLPADNKKKRQDLDLKELYDLQSKLMLVAGKAERGKDKVERFSQIFDGVIKLGSTYLKICEAGSILFKDWKARFYCNQDSKYCVQMDFQLVKKMLIGRPTSGLDILKHLDEICCFLENSLTDWTDYIQQQRSQHRELNYFTMSQLVRLRNTLAKLKEQELLDPEILHMLHIVKENCSESDLHSAMEDASNELKDQVKPMQPQTELLGPESQFIQTLMEEGFPERLAAKALKKFGADNSEDALRWCTEIQIGDEEESDEDEPTEMQSDKTWAWVQANLLQEAEESNSQNAFSLRPVLENVWKRFLSTSTQSVSDYLSMEHLGLVLKHLRLSDEHDLGRTAPKELAEGRPNLVACPARDILNVVLSIYYQDEAKPLPKRDEILFCTEDTTQEEVNLLWRRALADKSGRIFTILHVEKLSYDVCEMAVKELEQLMKDAKGYYLVIICASEMETKSQLVTAFENCRISSPGVPPDIICSYLKSKFTVEGDEGLPCGESERIRSTVQHVTSQRPGMGKSLFVRRLAEKLSSQTAPTLVTLPLHQRAIDMKKVLSKLLENVSEPGRIEQRIYHFDIAYEVLEGVDYLLFNLLVLGSVSDQNGNIWQRSPHDLYVIETQPRFTLNTQNDQDLVPQHVVLDYLPTLRCRSPEESKEVYGKRSTNQDYRPDLENWSQLDQLMDEKIYRSEAYRRVSFYLQHFSQSQRQNTVEPSTLQGIKEQCLEMLLRNFGVIDPSWAELHHFVAFLYKQLRDFEGSIFCSNMLAGDLPGFKTFVLHFMLQMSKDFASRSLVVSEETPGVQKTENLEKYQPRRKWENTPHPFLFFNDDKESLTFLGFNIERSTGNVTDPQTGNIIMKKIMTRQLYDALQQNGVNLSENFDGLPRQRKIEKLCKVIGVYNQDVYVHDPDYTYQLTTDNVKKILAVQMRFRCGIPVVVMGETGCGKTRLIQFMCDLQVPQGSGINNLVKVKTHGGTTAEDIRGKVQEACRVADTNMRIIRQIRGPDAYIQTVLFFDEANTTEAIGLIKEIMVDKRMDGQPLELNNGLKIVAACNPYRRHSEKMVKKLEQAGLGYYVKADETKEKLGEIPMRRLVYRVQALPQSMLPLVWDFGQLNTATEKLYIEQIVIRHLREENVDQDPKLCDVISSILAASQEYMRNNKDECIFVSLRDVERVMQVMMWFYKLRNLLFKKIDARLKQKKTRKDAEQEERDEDSSDDSQEDVRSLSPLVRSLILALGVCYLASLEKRNKYCKLINRSFEGPCKLTGGVKTIQEQIDCCQDVFIQEVRVADNIAKNLALKENLFMMVVCVELRIPLFLVGKPGSSKSLAKTIVADALEGKSAKSGLFKCFKQAHMTSCQCSRLSTAEVIVGTFKQCAKLQENKKDHLDEYVSVVVLDEVGLAEDSPHMPLKSLHPLLEDGCIGDDVPEKFKKVAFIGISNWALDPAKTNRGILVQRGVPKKDELKETAGSICRGSEQTKKGWAHLISPLTSAYWKVYKTGLEHGSEFFGLRDFYSLIKMLRLFSEKSKQPYLSWAKVMHAVWRNFDGKEDLGDQSNPLKIFEQRLEDHIDKSLKDEDDPQSSSFLSDSLSSDGRYLLIITEKDTPLELLHQQLPNAENAIVIYGSSFPRDQEYTQVCRNINSIKICMEAGRTVVLHNLENLYESLYDALNQYYIEMGSKRFVDLGLGTQRVKCIVHQDFRLIVVAEKETVYEKFSIPLINRLEKHFMHVSEMLTRDQNEIAERLHKWTKEFARATQKQSPADLLVGYHVDAAATVVLQISKVHGSQANKPIAPDVRYHIEQKCKQVLLESADPEALLRLPVGSQSFKDAVDVYFTSLSHESLSDYLHKHLISARHSDTVFCQITTYSKLLSSVEKDKIAKKLGWESSAVYLLSLQAFNTEQQFSKMLRNLFVLKKAWDRVLILQCDSGNEHNDLLACARHYIMNMYRQCQEELLDNPEEETGKTHVILVVQLPRQRGGCFVSFQGGKWQSAHLDDLRQSPHPITVQQLRRKSVRELVEDAVKQDQKCRQYLSQITNQAEGRMDEFSLSSPRSHEMMKETAEEDFDDMPALEEPDDDINVYRPERDRGLVVSPVDVSDIGMEDHVVDKGLTEDDGAVGDVARMNASDATTGISDAEIQSDDSRRETEGSSDKHIATEGGELCLQQLLFNCCSKAALMIRDVNQQHTLERLHTIKEHFPEPECVTTEYSDFAVIVQMRLLVLLLEKESQTGGVDQGRKWLNGALRNISEVGTFRRAWMSYIEKQLAPLLAGLLRYVDTNNNMAILEKTPQGHWLQNLWLLMFSSAAATPLKYKALLSLNSEKLPDEFMVRMTGYGGTEMSGSLPFSWVIKDALNNIMENAKYLNRQENDLDEMFHKTEIGKCLYKVYKEVGLQTVVDLYLDDYVQMVHRVVTGYPEREYMLIRKMIVTCYESGVTAGKELSTMKLSDVHSAFGKIQNRVQNLSQLLSVFPEGIDKVDEFMADPENKEHALVKTSEMTHDLICVEACIKHLKPDAKEVGKNPEMRQMWLLKVELMLPVIGRIIEQLGQFHNEFGPDCKSYHRTLRCIRDRVKAVYLFYKHVQSPQIHNDQMMTARIPVWSLLGDDCDFHTRKTMDQVKKIMNLCNDTASKMYLKIKERCGICEEAMKDPVQLPCKHIFCKPCLDEQKEFGDLGKCPSCGELVAKEFKITVMAEKKEAIAAHNRYKQRCNTFFIELIAQLVFVGHEQVEEEVLEMLLSCVTKESNLREAAKRTKQLTVLDDCIDPTPVVRSLLLQLLLRARVDGVQKYMDRYFHQARRFLGSDDEQLLQLCLLFVHSIQDSYYHSVSQIVPGSTNEMEVVRALFTEAEEQLDEPGLSMASIEAIGKLRFCLDRLASYISETFILKKGLSPDRLRNVLERAEGACSHERSDNLRWYLLRQLVRKSGLEYVVHMLKNNQKLVWILPSTISVKDFNQPHVLSIYGESMENMKVGIRQACRANDRRALIKAFQALPLKQRKIQLLVALFVDVTLSIADKNLDDQNLQNSTLVQCLDICQIDRRTELVKGLLGNQLGQHGKHLTIKSNQDITEQCLATLVTHFTIVLTSAPKHCLTKPFKKLIEAPHTMQNVLLPTMPQDDVVEIIENIKKDRDVQWNAQYGVYRCRNQHVFVVSGCGRLTSHNTLCPTCKEPIGGQGNGMPMPGVTNVRQDEIRDTTEKGHCLGPAHSRPANPYPKRRLNRLTTTVMRFFVHLALYAGANRSPQEVAGMIRPPLRRHNSVTTFMWDHLLVDLDLLSRCINRSRDDVFLLMHVLLKFFGSKGGTTAQVSLADKASREIWEETFANMYLNPVLNSCNAELQQATALLSGGDRFLKKLYEQQSDDGVVSTDKNNYLEELNFDDVFSLNSLWRYKTRICLEDVAAKLDEYRSQRKAKKKLGLTMANTGAASEKEDQDDCNVLYNFLEKHKQLSAIRYLPSITRLVRGLVRENHRTLYYKDVNTLSLERFLKSVNDRVQREMYSSLMDDFTAAWETVRPFLSSFVFGGLSVPKEYTSEPIRKDRTVIATLLPATMGHGLCAMGLINYLAELQNDFLRTIPGVNKEEGTAIIEEAFPSNLIYFNPDKDLLPMFLAHCDYSLEVGKTLQITYNFPALQRHLEERLLRGIPLIAMKVEHVVYREDLSNATKLANLEDIIPQVYLSGIVVRQIQAELHHLSDITDCLVMLDIALGFLPSFHYQQLENTLLADFLSETLGLNTTYFPLKARQACKLCHVKALWLLLSHESAKVLSRTDQNPFERVQKEYKEELSEDEKVKLERLLPHLNTELFLAELHECILMQITKPAKGGDSSVSNQMHRLGDVLLEYIKFKDDQPEIPVIQERRLPDTICASKCVSVWKFVFQKSIRPNW